MTKHLLTGSHSEALTRVRLAGEAARGGEDVEIHFSEGTKELAKQYVNIFKRLDYEVEEKEFSFLCRKKEEGANV